MADQADTALEAALRHALRVEGDALPFNLRVEDIDVRARRRSPLPRFIGVTAAAAAIVAVGVAGAASGLLRLPTSGPAAAAGGAALDALPTFDRLLDYTFTQTEIARAAGVSTGDVPATIATGIPTGIPLELVIACDGSPARLGVVVDGVRHDAGQIPCTGGMIDWPIAARETAAARDAQVTLSASSGTAWRAVLAGRRPPAGVLAGIAPVTGLPSLDDLAGYGATTAGVLARATGQASDVETLRTVPGLLGPDAFEVVFVCSGSAVELAFAAGPATADQLGAPHVECSGSPIVIQWPGDERQWPRDEQGGRISELHVRAQPGTAWEAVIRDTSQSIVPVPGP